MKHMNKQTLFNLEFNQYHFNCDTFKKRDISIILNTIIGGRLNDDMKFAGYGVITFDEENDSVHRYPKIKIANDDGTPIKETSRGINCLVFDLPVTYKNDTFNKLYLYHTIGSNKKGLWYGWVGYNTTTGKTSHRFFIDHDMNDLMVELNRYFFRINQHNHYDELLRQKRKEKLV